MFSQTEHDIHELEAIHDYIIPIGVYALALFIGFRLFKIIDFYSAVVLKRPLLNYMCFRSKKLTTEQRLILINNQPFYKKLSKTQQRHYEHRLATFLDKVTFVGKDDLVLTEPNESLNCFNGNYVDFWI